MDNKTRLTLIERLRDQNDDAAWEEFSNTYKDYIYVVIVRMGFNTQDSEDLHQQVILKLWNTLPDFSYNKDKRFRSWIARLTVNLCKDFIRSRSAKKNKLSDDDDLRDYYASVRLPEVEEISQKEWELFITNKALANIRSNFTGPSVDVFCEFMDGKTAVDIAAKYQVGTTSAHQMTSRVREKPIAEISRLNADLD